MLADFSYRCAPFAGPGYFLAGDAATFIDPIFSTGVCMGMSSGAEAGRAIVAAVQAGRRIPRSCGGGTSASSTESSSAFFRLVEPLLRPLVPRAFLNGQGPLEVHRAAMSILSGYVFPAPRLRAALALRAAGPLRPDQPLYPPRAPARALLAARRARGGGGGCVSARQRGMS